MIEGGLKVGKRYRNVHSGQVFLVGDVNTLGGVCDDCTDEALTGPREFHRKPGKALALAEEWPDLEEV